ncbi:hypothetical protein CLOM_g7247 [Closterium sp. NIES-68]|nr:hypothetical protein CLOM_g7247 [Closterium sp. NIES-68]GJP83258.1 hypothetical protein CLOP_g13431 [Closterium sp. NIES-67]
MAALAVSASISASAFCGQKLAVKNNVKAAPAKAVRFTAPRAKYGDESVYFDLKDLGNTTGSWDLYGNDGASPYNGMQAKFFETFAGLFTKRGILLKVLILGYAGAIGHFAANSTGDIIAIQNGPQKAAALGPRGKI